MSDMPPVLTVRDLTVDFRTRTGAVHALERVGFDVPAGSIVGIVGESGSGKSVTAYAIMGLLDRAARVGTGEIRFGDTDLLHLKPARFDELRGRDISMVFQNPRATLNPVRPIGTQIADVIARHQPGPARYVREQALAALRAVRIPDPERRLRAFPFELSGGMCQRVGIAMALACRPRLLIADEPTTGLDVTTQAVVMDLFREAVRAEGASAILITHDLALASEVCDRIVVMHAGHVVETAPVPVLFAAPRHPYTAKLLASVPSAADSIDALQPIEGGLPDLRRTDLPPCRFSERCERRAAICDVVPLPTLALAGDHHVACQVPL